MDGPVPSEYHSRIYSQARGAFHPSRVPSLDCLCSPVLRPRLSLVFVTTNSRPRRSLAAFARGRLPRLISVSTAATLLPPGLFVGEGGQPRPPPCCAHLRHGNPFHVSVQLPLKLQPGDLRAFNHLQSLRWRPLQGSGHRLPEALASGGRPGRGPGNKASNREDGGTPGQAVRVMDLPSEQATFPPCSGRGQGETGQASAGATRASAWAN